MMRSRSSRRSSFSPALLLPLVAAIGQYNLGVIWTTTTAFLLQSQRQQPVRWKASASAPAPFISVPPPRVASSTHPATTTTTTTTNLQTSPDTSESSTLEDGSSSTGNNNAEEGGETTNAPVDKNTKYIEGLLENLVTQLDKWILTGIPAAKTRVQNIFRMIESEAVDPELVQRAVRLMKRAGFPFVVARQQQQQIDEKANKAEDPIMRQRREQAEERKRWEAKRAEQNTPAATGGRSALSRRTGNNGGKPDLFLGQVDANLLQQNQPQLAPDPDSIAAVVADKNNLHQEFVQGGTDGRNTNSADATNQNDATNGYAKARSVVSKIIALTGAGSTFDGETLGIGGLDAVVAQFRRRIWIPLATPPQVLEELGIHPVRGLLLYGKPGCGKTLLARKLGAILSPMRPVTVVSGPEVMDKFVGSSEKNLREIFDNPPDIYPEAATMLGNNGGGSGGDDEFLEKAALHVVILDEFDAIARARGGSGGSGAQGDAGVARDSVVNQLLAKMDGVDPLCVPTLVIGLTNRRSLIEPALLRPGRFEVQIEVPPPRTAEQRISILKVHTRHMHQAGRLLVRDTAAIGPAANILASVGKEKEGELLSYEELLQKLAAECDGFSGASLAAVSRAAASHALERAVEEFTTHPEDVLLLEDCVVTLSDFEDAVNDVKDSLGDSDWAEPPEEKDENDDATNGSTE